MRRHSGYRLRQASLRRQPLFQGELACVFDPRHVRIKRWSESEYFARDHVVVSYNGDLRGIVEDFLQRQRRVRCSVSSFANLGAVVDGSALLATVPDLVGRGRYRSRSAGLRPSCCGR